MIWKIQACKTILRRSRCQLKPKTLPHLHMCPSVCFYTLFFQPVGEVVFIQAAVWSFFSPTSFHSIIELHILKCMLFVSGHTFTCTALAGFSCLSWKVSSSSPAWALQRPAQAGLSADQSQGTQHVAFSRWQKLPSAGRPVAGPTAQPSRAGENGSAFDLFSGEPA